MRSLFLKSFLWFWATAILTAFALLLTFVLQPGGVPSRWHAALGATAQTYGRAAVGEMESGGSAAVAAYLDDLDHNAHTQACLFDADGKPIAGHNCASFQELVKRTVSSTTPAFGFRYGLARVGLQVQGRNGGSYIFATELPVGPRAAFGPDLAGLALHWSVAFLVSGFICYLLTRHLTPDSAASRGFAPAGQRRAQHSRAWLGDAAR